MAEKKVSVISRIESAAGWVHTAQGDRPYVDLRLWLLDGLSEKSTPTPWVRMSADKAQELVSRLQEAISAPSTMAQMTKPPGPEH